MLHEFIVSNRVEIIARCLAKLTTEPRPLASEVEYGVPLFLDQLAETLSVALGLHPDMVASASRHGAELWERGYTIGQVVHDYGGICQSITELAVETNVPITTIEFKTLNRCLDDAIAEAATEYGRLRGSAGAEEVTRLASDRMASVGMLAAGIVHEINNPLTSVMANLQLAMGQAAALDTNDGRFQELREQLKDSLASAERIRSVVGNVRMFSRSEETVSHPVHVEPILESSLRMAWNEVRHRARVVRSYASTSSFVAADESRLGQVFLNLIVNAAQSIEEGHADGNEITVLTKRSGQTIVVEVSDSGMGIPPQQLERLFAPFFTTKPRGIGTGLGLSICHRIITDLGGTVEVDSILGQGSTFRVLLPAVKRSVDVAVHLAPEVVEPIRRGRVLIIDDEVDLGRVARRILQAEHDVVVTTSAREALAWIIAGENFDVILCDLMMPELNGQDFYSELQSFSPGYAGRVIFMTGGAFSSRATSFLAQVTAAHLDKPFDVISLRNIVNRALAVKDLPTQ